MLLVSGGAQIDRALGPAITASRGIVAAGTDVGFGLSCG